RANPGGIAFCLCSLCGSVDILVQDVLRDARFGSRPEPTDTYQHWRASNTESIVVPHPVGNAGRLASLCHRWITTSMPLLQGARLFRSPTVSTLWPSRLVCVLSVPRGYAR